MSHIRTPCHYQKLEELEATRHAALEDALRIITPTHILQPFSPPPFTKHLLPHMRIIEIDIARLHIVCSGSDVHVIDKRQGNGFDGGGVLGILPGPRELGHDDGLAVGGKGGYCLLQERRACNDRGDNRLEGHGPDDTLVIPNSVAGALPKVVGLMQQWKMEIVCRGGHYLTEM